MPGLTIFRLTVSGKDDLMSNEMEEFIVDSRHHHYCESHKWGWNEEDGRDHNQEVGRTIWRFLDCVHLKKIGLWLGWYPLEWYLHQYRSRSSSVCYFQKVIDLSSLCFHRSSQKFRRNRNFRNYFKICCKMQGCIHRGDQCDRGRT